MTSAIEVDAAAHGSAVSLARGQPLVVCLVENPSTGYRWSLEAGAGLQLDADVFTPAGAGIGAAGQRRLTLRAAAPGTFRLVLLHRREWEPPAMALASFVLSVTALP